MQIPDARDPVAALREALPDVLLDVKQFRDETTLIVDPERVVETAQFLRDTTGLVYNFLSDISAVDYWPETTRPERFGLSYHLYSMLYNRRIRVKVYVPEDDPVVPTMTGVWPGANWLEREVFDMMGIRFDGHPDMRRVLMPDDWQGHPQRRDYPLGYEQVQFSFNVEEALKHKPLAKK
jgi:NADH-quinone oxidoreductase subunit C